MDNTRCRQFFLEPAETYHRQYEALRACFVDGRRLQESPGSLGTKSRRYGAWCVGFGTT